ncbi:MarR family transcriptional regulator [Nonomuraea deserti]|uniref:MarR family transcriptional regulator n=2 Tax=Nonomuraea deserti TaxID=1848322 RepID=A0A4R4VCF5_9ACTN|nr:MarR family transcriptional regulator [Nonomuraea deserti]
MSLENVQVSSGSDFHPAEEIVGAEGAADREPTWTFLTNHARVLVILAGNPRARIRDIAATIGITERAAHGIITDLVQEGYVERVREGRRNRYAVVPGRHLRDPSQNTVPVHGSSTCSPVPSQALTRAAAPRPNKRQRHLGGVRRARRAWPGSHPSTRGVRGGRAAVGRGDAVRAAGRLGAALASGITLGGAAAAVARRITGPD